MTTKRVALVTGGSTGIGEATARLLVARGYEVVITGRTAATLESAAKTMGATWVAGDIGDPADAARAVDEVKRRHGRLDLLVNNAGIATVAGLGDATPGHVRRLFDVNVVGLIETTRAALPMLRASTGNIVNVASTVADRPFANMSVYSATKAAVLALTRAWAKELAADGVRVNAVSPGPIATPIHAPDKLGIPQEAFDALGAAVAGLVPLKRFGESIEVAEVIAFVGSPAASYVNGAEYTVGGGIEAS